MRKILQITIFVCLMLITGFVIHADELDDINKQLATLTAEVNSKESDKVGIAKQIGGIRSRVEVVEAEVARKEREVAAGEKTLVHQKSLLDERARSYYKNINKSGSALVGLLIGENFSDSLQNFFYQKVIVDEDRNAIVKIVLYIKNLEDTKQKLVEEKKQLAEINVQLDKQTTLLEGEIASTRSKIAQLSAQQQSLIAAKLSKLNIPRSAGTSSSGCSSDLTNGKNPGFSPHVGFFTYGAPHRNGMNQYGALGRAKASQNEEQILSEYYPGMTLKKDYDKGVQISTTTGWSGSIEDYVKRIYEVPDSWTDNNLAVLKAQAVAARTYALRSTSNGANQICTTESCQVFKPEPKGGNWEQAANATAGWVLMDGGNLGFTQYASTHGGYILNLGKFDGSGGNPGSFGELNERAYDKDSPWFYCNWGSRPEFDGTAWLKPSEVADILNVIELARRDSGTSDKLYQPDKPHPYGGEVWSPGRVRDELRSRGGSPIESVSNLSVGVDFGSGKTTSISGGGISASGDEFKSWFNLRAPANIQIVGPLYNVETR